MKKEIKSKAKTKSKSKKGNVTINNTNKVIIQNPKRRAYRKKNPTIKGSTSIPSQNYPVVTYFNPEPIRKESPNELLNLAQNYISPPQIMNTQNQEEDKDIRLIETTPNPDSKVQEIRTRPKTERKSKAVDISDATSLKGLPVKDLRKLFKANGVSNEITKKISLKTKNEIIDDYVKRDDWNKPIISEESNAGGAVFITPKKK